MQDLYAVYAGRLARSFSWEEESTTTKKPETFVEAETEYPTASTQKKDIPRFPRSSQIETSIQ